MRAATVALTASILFSSPASASETDPLEVLVELDSAPTPTERTVELLAQLMVSEGGWDSPADHAAVAWAIASRFVALRRARRAERLDDAILLYADVLDGPTSGRPLWVSQLRADCRRPAAMDARLRWDLPRVLRSGRTAPSRAERCAEIFARSEMFLFGVLDMPCDRVPEHWGGPMDDARAARAVARGAWREVSCGTANHFFEVVPRAERRPVRGPIRIAGRVVTFVSARP